MERRSGSSSSRDGDSSNEAKSQPRQPLGKHVLVIGAGLSGLGAAKKLQANGYRVTVLEAQDKVGGRTRTNRNLGVAFDEGASWIHGIERNPITELAKDAGMKTVPCDDDSIVCYDQGGRLRSDEEYDEADTEFGENIYDSIQEYGSPHLSVEEIFRKIHPEKANDRLWRFILSAYMTFNLGDLDKLSSTGYDQGEEFGGDEALSTSGYDMIPKYLSQGLDIQLNQRV